ncbi:ATP-binding cassette [Conglomerata obtusa]
MQNDTATKEFLSALKSYPFPSENALKAYIHPYKPNTKLQNTNNSTNQHITYTIAQPRIPLDSPFTMRSTTTRKCQLDIQTQQEVETTYEQSSSYDSDHTKAPCTDLHYNNIDLAIAGKKILENCTFRVVQRRIYGLVGRNGIGKSTMLKAMRKRRFDTGAGMSMYLSRQESRVEDCTVYEYVTRGCENDDERDALMMLQEIGFSTLRNTKISKDEGNITNNAPKDSTAKEINKDNDRDSDRDNNKINIKDNNKDINKDNKKGGNKLFSVDTMLQDLSGGWLVRANLARALFTNPDVLLLDEPTNMLDIPTIVWLEQKLKNLCPTAVIVSHDREFLNNVCTDILFLDDLHVKSFTGNYDSFLIQREIQKNNQQKAYEKQKIDREHLQAFIDKFRYNAKRASLAQSKIKILENMKIIKAVREDPLVKFRFNSTDVKGTLIELKGVSFSYNTNIIESIISSNDTINKVSNNTDNNTDSNTSFNDTSNNSVSNTVYNNTNKNTDIINTNSNNVSNNADNTTNYNVSNNTNINNESNDNAKISNANTIIINNSFIDNTKNNSPINNFTYILEDVSIKITHKSRIVIVGPNGAGKSTLLKLLSTKIFPQKGSVISNPKLKPGYFTQHHIDQLNLNEPVLSHIMKHGTEEKCRSVMAGFGLIADRQKINTLSGGQKSRLAFSKISLQSPNILLLDEPTNHLDIESIDGLSKCLKEYSGAVICVSHDLKFVEEVFEEVWICKDKKLTYFKGTIRDYRNSLIKSN